MANEFIARKGLIALEASQITGSLTVNGGITGSLQGTSSWAINALTASSVTTLNQNVLITGSLTIGSSSIGSSENTLIIGPAPAGGTGEGGQILLQAVGGTYATASMIDNYQNKFRVLRGTNASSDAFKLSIDMHTGQVQIPNYNSTTAFTSTAVVGILGFDSNGNLLTTTASAGGGGGGGGVTINNNVDNYLVTATGTANTLNGEANLTFNDGTLTLDVASATGGTVSADTLAAANFITVEKSGYGYLSTPRNMISLPQSTPPYGFPMPGCKIADAWDVGAGITTLRSGSIVYFKYDAGLGISEWEPAHAHTTASAIWPLGVVTDTISHSEIILEGVVRMTGSFSGRAGQPLYLAATLSGSALTTAPTGSGRVVRLVGYLLDENRNLVYFNPSMDWSVLV